MKKILAMVLVGCTALLGASMFASAETVELPTDPATYVVVNDDASGASVWTESNGRAGLQTEAGEDEQGAYEADDQNL